MSYITYLISKFFRSKEQELPENFLEKYKKLCEVQSNLENVRFETYISGKVVQNLDDNTIHENFKKYNKLFLDDGDICTFLYLDEEDNLAELDVIDPYTELDLYDIIVPVIHIQ